MNRLALLFLLIITSCSDKFIGIVKTNSIQSEWNFSQTGNNKLYPANVPGVVQLDLLHNGLIEDPLFKQNEKTLQWVSEKDWTYSTEFYVDDSTYKYKHIDFVFDGLDTYADVFLNDKLILSADNMFRHWKVDGKKYVVKGNNFLKVIFHSPSVYGKKEYEKSQYLLPASESIHPSVSPYVRKAAYQFGWDWSPRVLTMGIWQPVKMVAHDGVYISSILARTVEIADSSAWISAYITTESDVDIRGAVFTVQDAFKEAHIKKGTTVTEVQFRVFNPELWWPVGYGKQSLYSVKARLYVNNYLVDSVVTKTGIRTIELFQDDEESGKSFYFRVNGLPIFIKGANYVPQSMFLTDVSNSSYKSIINACADVGINMLRVWGGGIYERNLFYDLCDEKGILVWQDFMFAGAMYPGNKQFVDNVKDEITYQVQRLRNHPSIALWCGNNEIDVAWKNWGWQKSNKINPADSTKMFEDYLQLFEKEIPEIVEQLSPSRPYLPSSPISNWGNKEKFKSGNMHYWGVWHGEEAIDSFKVNIPRFMTEYGMQSYPSYTSLKKNTDETRITLNSDFIKNRQRSYKGNSLLIKYVEDYYGKVGNTEELCYLSQLNQAEALRIAIESHRNNAPYCMGTMFWQLNDVWDGASWSTIEKYGKWKASHYKLKRLYAKDILISKFENDTLVVSFQSESTSGRSGKLFLDVIDLRGRVIGSYTRDVSVSYLLSDEVFKMSISELLGGKLLTDFFIKGKVVSKDSIVADMTSYLVKPKELNLLKPNIETKVTLSEEGGTVEAVSDVLAFGVTLEFEGVDATFSDNYFDLLPGEKKIIEFNFQNNDNLELKLIFRTYNELRR